MGNPLLAGTPPPPPNVRAQQGPFQAAAAAQKSPIDLINNKLTQIGMQIRNDLIPLIQQAKPDAMPIVNKLMQGFSELMQSIAGDHPSPGTMSPPSPPGPDEIPPPPGTSAAPGESPPGE